MLNEQGEQQPPLEEENERDTAVAQAQTTQGEKPGDSKFGQKIGKKLYKYIKYD